MNNINKLAEAYALAKESKSEPTYRLLRVLEYVGDAEFIRKAIDLRAVKGRLYTSHKKENYIQEGIIGETMEVLAHGDDNETQNDQ